MKTPALFFALAALPLAAHAQGTIKATTRMRPDGTMATTVLNPDTRTSEETITEAGTDQRPGKVLSKTVYFLNEQNFAKGATHLDAKGNVRYKESYKFDYSGKIMEATLFGPNNEPLGRRVFVYEGKAQPVRVEDYDANGNLLSGGRKAGPARGTVPEVRRAMPVR